MAIGCRCCDVIGPGLWPLEPNPMEVPQRPLTPEEVRAVAELLRATAGLLFDPLEPDDETHLVRGEN